MTEVIRIGAWIAAAFAARYAAPWRYFPQEPNPPPCRTTTLHRSSLNGKPTGKCTRPFVPLSIPWERSCTFWTCSPIPAGTGCTSAIRKATRPRTLSARFERHVGRSVLHPMGFDAFGLPAEDHAIKTNTPPRQSTERNIANFRRQLKMLGFSYDWRRELATTDRGYFCWTQWIFLVLFDTWFDRELQRGRPIAELPIPAEVQAQGAEAVRRYQDDHRLAYQADALVNWCPGLGTVVANEEVIDGRSERGGYPVQRIPLRQWMLRITEYGDRLEQDLDRLEWPDSIKTMQREWIGRSTGAEVDFFIGPADGYDAWRQQARPAGLPAQGERGCAAHLHHPARHVVRRHLHGHRAGTPVCAETHDGGPASGRGSLLCAAPPPRVISTARNLSERKNGGIYRVPGRQSGQR